MKPVSIFLITTIFFFISCTKENSTPDFSPSDKGSITVEFDNVAGDQDLALNTGVYTNAVGETYSVTKFNYYISNIVLKNEDGSEYTVPKDDSYFLIKEDDETTHEVELEDIPAGNYTGIKFTVGVDSLTSVAPVDERTGMLDPAGAGAAMYWDINSGYVFLEMECN